VKKLGQVAHALLGIPAVATSSERVFSTAGWTAGERRTAQSGDSVGGLKFLHGQTYQLTDMTVMIS